VLEAYPKSYYKRGYEYGSSAPGIYWIRLNPSLRGKNIYINLSETIQPNGVCKFSIVPMGEKYGDKIAFYHIQILIEYNETNSISMSKPILFPVISSREIDKNDAVFMFYNRKLKKKILEFGKIEGAHSEFYN
jgi:hypothetical protein